MGLVGVLATQLWHHKYIDGSLADLPSNAGAARPAPSHNGAVRLPAAADPVAAGNSHTVRTT
jgi:hypothetical protein